MKRYLLLCLVCVCVSIGALAQSTWETKYWFSDGSQTTTELVALVHNQPGGLAAAISAITNVYSTIRVEGELSASDIESLESAPFITIDLQDAYYMENGQKKAFVFGNSTVKNLILPDNWSKKEVNAVAEHMPALGSAISFGTEDFVVNGQTKESPSLIAYVKTGNTLYDALFHSYYDGNSNEKIGKINPYDGVNVHKLKSVVISGNPVARDFSNGQLGFDDDGHFVFNEAPVEGPGEATRTLVGTSGLYGALNQASTIVSLDLSGAYVTEDDLTLSYTWVVGAATKEVIIPTDPRVTTIPADFLNNSNGVKQICIPSNIQVIKSRALTRAINHIWTNNPNVDEDGNPIEDGVCYDNGYVIVTGTGDEKTETRYYGQMPFDQNTFSYGTYTFPAGLKLIESYAFRHQVGIEEASSYNPSVSDVYMLSEIAPECHLDAFHSTMYYGNNTIDATVALQAEGIITREAYTNNAGNYNFITILHYPANTTTPNIQRYIDPTRRYSVASTMTDGRGSTVYFPTQTEMIRSYEQAVTGYVWNAWDPTRNNDGSLGFLNTTIDNSMTIQGWTAANQAAANQAWKDNNSSTDKTYTSYYDVTLGGDAQPTGLVPYSSVYWNETQLSSSGTPEQQLYPAPEMSAPYNKYIVADPASDEDLYVYRNGNYEPYSGAIDPSVTYYTTVKTQDKNSDGSLKYSECDNGTFVAYTGYKEDSEGSLVRDVEVNAAGDLVREYSWVPTDAGDYVRKFTQQDNGTYFKKYTFAEDSENGEWIVTTLWNGNIQFDPWYSWMPSTTKRYSKSYVGIASVPQDGIDNLPQGKYEIPNSVKGNLGGYELSNGFDGDGIFYNKVYSSPIKYIAYDETRDLADEVRYLATNEGYRNFNSETDADFQRYEPITLYREAAEGETGTHCPVMVAAVFQDVLKQNDYRGWHQFILGAYSQNTKLINVPLKSYITDSEWWTICLPYDLRYTDMIALYGGSEDEVTKIPYLSKLLYVVRDVQNSHITLMFSKNLMQYKEHEPNSELSINYTTNHVHGVIDDLQWSPEEIADNPVILHAGVPYLIKPYIPTGASRQFNIYRDQLNAQMQSIMEGELDKEDGIRRIHDNELYANMANGRNRSGDDQKDLIYKGEYEVPAYLINNPAGAESPIDETTLKMKDGSQFTYTSNSEFDFYGKKYDMKISSDFTYTFVGTFYLSIIPQYAYFLGWDSSLNKGKGGAAFWYNRVLDKSQWAWNNETGIICANWPKDQLISKATSLNSPARWVVTDAEGKAEPTAEPVQVANDDFGQTSSSQPAGVRAGSTTMLFGNSMLVHNGQDGIDDVVSDDAGIPDAINGVNANSVNGKWYNVNGQRMNGVPVQSGVYIVNGKKYVVR